MVKARCKARRFRFSLPPPNSHRKDSVDLAKELMKKSPTKLSAEEVEWLQKRYFWLDKQERKERRIACRVSEPLSRR